MKKTKEALTSAAMILFSFLLAITAFFLLPEKIFVQVISSSPVPETNTLLFLITGFALTGLCSLMCMFNEESKKWLALQAVLTLAYFVCIVYNLIVL